MNPSEIIQSVSEITGVDADAITAPGRKARTVYARTMAIAHIKCTAIGWSLTNIADVFGMDHANVCHTLTRHRRLMETDPAYNNAFAKLAGMDKL